MKIDQSVIEDIKSRIDIVDVIGDFISLKRTGQHFKARSPFSDEKTPSFIVFPRNQNFKDFSSGKQGDAITFIMEYDGLSYVDALKYLAKKYGIEIKEDAPTAEEILEQNERESLLIVLNFAKDFYRMNLWESDEGRSVGLSYFRERGFSDDIIEKFDLGYSLDEWSALLEKAKSNQYNPDIMEKAGLIIHKDEKVYDRFRGRVIFPVHSLTGKVIAFGARILTNEKNQPKYINSPETEVYHKSDVLYGMYQAGRAIRHFANCYLVEGYTDVISMHQAGVENVVASSGTALTESQIKLIQRQTDNITVLFDGDAAGVRASIRGIDMILQQGMDVKVVFFPDGEDPDSYSRKVGPARFKEFLQENTEDFISFKTRLLQEGHSSDPVAKAKTITDIIGSIALIPQPIKRAVFIKETANRLGIDEQILYGELNKILIGKQRERQESAFKEEPQFIVEKLEKEIQKSAIDPIEYQECEAIRLLLNYGYNQIEDEYNLVEHYIEELETVEFSNPVFDSMFNIFRQEVNNGHVVGPSYFQSHPDAEIQGVALDLVSEKYEVSENWRRYKIFVPKELEVLTDSVYRNILRIKFHKIKKLILLNLETLRQERDTERQTELQRINMELKKAEAAFAAPLGIVVS